MTNQTRALIPDWVSSAYGGRSTPHRNANVAGEGLRQLNHSLGQIAAAADAYDVIASLAYCLERMPQALDHMRQWLASQEEQDLLDLDGDTGDVAERLAQVRQAIRMATDSIFAATAHMRDAHNGMSRVRGPLTPEQRAELEGGAQ